MSTYIVVEGLGSLIGTYYQPGDSYYNIPTEAHADYNAGITHPGTSQYSQEISKVFMDTVLFLDRIRPPNPLDIAGMILKYDLWLLSLLI